VRVRVAEAAVNPTDLAFRAGAHRSMPDGMQPAHGVRGRLILAF
jgi:hypothetical protein